MTVLGRDGRDFSRGHHESLLVEQQQEAEAARALAAEEHNEKSSWWNWKFSTKSNDDDDDVASVASYVSMGAAEEAKKSAVVKRAAPRKLSRDLSAPASGAAFISVATSDNVPTLTPSREEAVRQDCSFFYQDVDDQLQSPQRESEISHAIEDFPPRYRAAYRARFQELNEDRHEVHVNDDDNELWLYDEELTTPTPEIPRVSDVAHSSLCWAQDGRILMKLPKDKVRLLMDSHLEPGILSVEHDVATGKTEGGADPDEVMYVLTVDDNLYRRVVGEMSDAAFSPCRLHHFCNDEGRLDISVAILLLAIVLVILLVNTIIWPVE
jgi:hypothetical protein